MAHSSLEWIKCFVFSQQVCRVLWWNSPNSYTYMALTFLASSILFSKMYVMQFLTTSSLRALLAIMLPFLSTVSPVETGRSDQALIHHWSTEVNPIKRTLTQAARVKSSHRKFEVMLNLVHFSQLFTTCFFGCFVKYHSYTLIYFKLIWSKYSSDVEFTKFPI